MLGWIVDAGGLGIVVAWSLVCVSFLLLRHREPEMDRPFRVPAGYATGAFAFALSGFFVFLYLPGGPSALVWPYEWLMVLLWTLLDVGLFALSPRGRKLIG
jgi:APA family basic amino acid/polyamine antiporter